jgi:hypothetical protein
MNTTQAQTQAVSFAVAAQADASAVADAAFSHPGLFQNLDDLRAFRAEWKALADKKELTSVHMAAYALLMGRSLEAAFAPVTNPVKLANGHAPHASLKGALRSLKVSPALPAGLEKTSAGYRDALVAAIAARG